MIIRSWGIIIMLLGAGVVEVVLRGVVLGSVGQCVRGGLMGGIVLLLCIGSRLPLEIMAVVGRWYCKKEFD
jgi:hypothetical protein